MGYTKKIESGKRFYSDFLIEELPEEITMTPVDITRYSLSENPGHLRLKHGATPLYCLINNEEDKIVVEMKNVYNPTVGGDVGGILAYADSTHNLKVQEYYNEIEGIIETYPYLRLVKNGNRYDVYSSIDGTTWVLEGTRYIVINTPRVGAFIDGNPDGAQNLDIDYLKVFKSLTLRVDALTEGMKVELYDSGDILLDTKICQVSATQVLFDISAYTLPLSGYFKVYDELDVLLETTDLDIDIWGGDEWQFALALTLYMDGVELSNVIDEFLGYISKSEEVQLELKNEGDIQLTKTVSIVQNGTNVGYNLAWFAPDVAGVAGEYTQDSFEVTLEPGASMFFWLKVERDETTTSSDELNFYIQIP